MKRCIRKIWKEQVWGWVSPDRNKLHRSMVMLFYPASPAKPQADSTWCRDIFLVPFKCVLTLPLARCGRTETRVSGKPFRRTTQTMHAWIPVLAQWESLQVEPSWKQLATPASHEQERAGSDWAPGECRTSRKMAQEHLTGAPKVNWFPAVMAHKSGKDSGGNWLCVRMKEHRWCF